MVTYHSFESGHANDGFMYSGALMWRYTYDVITGKVEYRPASIGS